MRIALIDPSGDVSGFNAGLAYICAVLRGRGHEVRVFDCNNLFRSAQRVSDSVLDFCPQMVGFSIKTNTYDFCRVVAQRLRTVLGDSIHLIAGGAGVTCQGKVFLSDEPVYDACCLGEVEERIGEYADVLASKGSATGLEGIYTRASGSADEKIVLVERLDTLPFPDFSAFDTGSLLPDRYPLVTSRGCPFQCTYCAVNKISGSRWRARSPENVIAELRQAKQRYGIRSFEVADDNFTMDMARARKICSLLISERLDLSWRCVNGIRADKVDDSLLGLMRQAGCTTVWFGIETLDEDVFSGINKGEPMEAVLTAVRSATKAGLAVGGFFIAGLPGSSYAQDQETLRKAKDLGLDEMLWSLATPYPRTSFWEYVKEHSGFSGDYRSVSFFKDPRAVFETREYPARKKLSMVYEGNVKGYSYGCFFSRRITLASVLRMWYMVVRYDAGRILTHIGKIFFGRYHRRYFKEFFKRLFSFVERT